MSDVWVSVNQGLPPHGVPVICAVPNENPEHRHLFYMGYRTECGNWTADGETEFIQPTKWHLIPQLEDHKCPQS